MFLTMLERLMKEHNLNPNQLSKQSGVPYMTIKNFWTKGYNGVRISTVRQLADFFNVSLDYLVLGKETKSDLDKNYEKLNEFGQKKVKEYIKDLTENPKYLKNSAQQKISDDIASDLRNMAIHTKDG